MKRLLISLFALILSIPTAFGSDGSQVKSQAIEGVFQIANGRAYIQLKNGRLRLELANPSLKTELMRLKNGDFISGQGKIDPKLGRALLEELDTVGLQHLIGAWRSRSGDIFEFRDFFLMRLYTPVVTATTQAGIRILNYTLAPDDVGQNRWSIFMADKQSLLLGSLEIKSSSVLLKLYDPDSGKQTSVMELHPMR